MTEAEHHPGCHYDYGYCDAKLCWDAAAQDRRAIARIARYSECPGCGQACDGSCDEHETHETRSRG